MLSSPKIVAATSVLGVGIGAPLVQNGSVFVDCMVCAIDTGEIETINNRSKVNVPSITAKLYLNIEPFTVLLYLINKTALYA
jgi:hypothetical protein